MKKLFTLVFGDDSPVARFNEILSGFHSMIDDLEILAQDVVNQKTELNDEIQQLSAQADGLNDLQNSINEIKSNFKQLVGDKQ